MSHVVIKLGGDLLDSPHLDRVIDEIATIQRNGQHVVVVHGGGPQSSALQKKLGQTPTFVGGRRVTDASTLEVAKMVTAGRLNVDLCAALVAKGAHPIGLNGSSSLAVKAVRRPPRVVAGGGPDPVDFGFVGDVVGLNSKLFALLIDAGHIPVVAPLGGAENGAIFNINADVVANQVAVHLQASHLVLVTNVPGVLRDIDDPASRIATLTRKEAAKAIDEGVIAGGMIPKVQESLRGLEQGIGAVHIVGASTGFLRELSDPGSQGTALLP